MGFHDDSLPIAHTKAAAAANTSLLKQLIWVKIGNSPEETYMRQEKIPRVGSDDDGQRLRITTTSPSGLYTAPLQPTPEEPFGQQLSCGPLQLTRKKL